MLTPSIRNALEKHELWLKDDGSKGVQLRLIGEKLHNLNFGTCNLQSADFTDCELVDCNFGSANLQYANLVRCDLRDSQMMMANLNYASLKQVTMTGVYAPYLSMREALLMGVDFMGATLHHMDMWNANFYNLNFTSCDMTSAEFVVLGTDPRGYEFFLIHDKVSKKTALRAGCRSFHTVGEAYQHWFFRHSSYPETHDYCMEMVELARRVARNRQWNFGEVVEEQCQSEKSPA